MSEEGYSGPHVDDTHNVEEGGIWVTLGNKREQDVQSEMLEIMRSLKVDLESIKANHKKILKPKAEQEEITKLC